MIYSSSENRKDYFLPVAGNGSININVGYDGTMRENRAPIDRALIAKNHIWWEGRRYFNMGRALIPFGYFREIFPNPISWTQSLDTKAAIVTSECRYDFGTVISKTFVHHDYNLICLKKVFNITEKKDYTFTYSISKLGHWKIYDPSFDTELPKRFSIKNISSDNGICIDYLADGYHQYNGRIHIFSNKNFKSDFLNNTATMKGTVSPGEEVCFYIALNDDFESDNYKSEIDTLKEFVMKNGFDFMQNTHSEKWLNYMAEGYVKMQNTALCNVYDTAQYSLKTQTTRWSIPVGINHITWEGTFFAFDEYYSYYGLLTSNHLSLAKRVPEFRYNNLSVATVRATCFPYKRNDDLSPISEDVQARFPWQTIEDGTEAAPIGHWMDHIFHMAAIASSAFEYYKYSDNIEYLKEKYDLIKACANFYLLNSIYVVEGDKYIIGKCTDLERFDASIGNAYFTTCGVIKTLRYVSEAAEILNIDHEYAKKCKYIADKLFDGLPNDGEKYIPFPGCEQKSISVFTGLYPFNVIPINSIMQRKAIDDYLKYELDFGNMYAVGKGISSWYSAIKACGFALLRDPENAIKAANQVADCCGCFSECFEINEPEIILKPWFTTSAGTYISAVNLMLIQKNENNIYLLPGIDKDFGDVSFKLLVDGNIYVEVEVKNNCIQSLKSNADSSINFIIPNFITDNTGRCIHKDA